LEKVNLDNISLLLKKGRKFKLDYNSIDRAGYVSTWAKLVAEGIVQVTFETSNPSNLNNSVLVTCIPKVIWGGKSWGEGVELRTGAFLNATYLDHKLMIYLYKGEIKDETC